MSIDRAQKLLAAASRMIRVALDAGYTVSVHDGEEFALKRSTDYAAIRAALASTEGDVLRFRNTQGESVGFVELLWSLGPEEFIADWSDNAAVDTIVANANADYAHLVYCMRYDRDTQAANAANDL